MSPTSAQWLLLAYAPLESSPKTPLGVVLYAAETDELYFRLRADAETFAVDECDLEILALTSTTIRSMIKDHGRKSVFDWLESSLSNVIRAEGPFDVVTMDPEATTRDLFKQHVTQE